MGKGKTFVQEYEANSSEIRKQYEKSLLGDVKTQNTNKTPKKKKRKKS
jgi:hypothetical protein